MKLFRYFLAPKFKLIKLFVLLLLSSTFELLTTGSVLILVEIAINGKIPALIPTNQLDPFLISKDSSDIIQYILLACLLIFIVSACFRYLYLKNSLTLVQLQRHEVSKLLLLNYISSDYASTESETSGEKARKILSESDNLIYTFYMPILNILSSTVSIAFFLFGLFIALNIVSMIGFCLLATVFALIFILNKKKLRSISSKRNLSNSQRYDKAIYLLNALKEMKIYGKLDYFFKPFEESSINYSISIAESQVISQSPRIFIESIIFILLTSFLLFSFGSTEKSTIDLAASLPRIATLAFIIIKSLPKIHIIFHSLSQLQIGKTIVNELRLKTLLDQRLDTIKYNDYNSTKKIEKIILSDFTMSQCGEYFRGKSILINGMTNYTDEFNIGDVILIKGESGLGKTSLLDKFAGFGAACASIKHISNGSVISDNNSILRSISYVNQILHLYVINLRKYYPY